MPSDLAFKALNRAHHLVLELTRGRIGWRAGGMVVIELTTTGRRSGRSRVTMLTSPYQDDTSVVIVASRDGDAHHPAWFLNLREQPDVYVSVGGRPGQLMRAEVAAGAERQRLWALLTTAQPRYERYQRKTHREIPVITLRPFVDS